MASQVLDEMEVAPSQGMMSQGMMASEILGTSGTTPSVRETASFPQEADCMSGRSEMDGSCWKGFFVAITLEGFMALALYGIWRVWTMLR